MNKLELESQLFLAEKKLEQAEDYNPKRHKDRTRSEIALFVVKAFFYLIASALILIPIYNQVAKPELSLSLVDVITVLSGVISGPFGFVVGYYFKGSESE